jgi:hypothetical protein
MTNQRIYHRSHKPIQKQESEEIKRQYHLAIEALANSIQMQLPVKEEEEMSRLLKTITPEELKQAKTNLIVDLMRQTRVAQSEALLVSLLERLGEGLQYFFSQGAYETVGNTLRTVYRALGEHPQEEVVRTSINSAFTPEQIRELVEQLLRKCQTFEPRETSVVDAVCHLYERKAGDLLIDILGEAKDDGSPQVKWIVTTLATLGPELGNLLSSRLEQASDRMLPRLLTLVAIAKQDSMVPFVEKLLDHKDQDIRLKAITTMGHLHAERMVPRLAEIVLQKGFLKTRKLKDQQLAAVKALAEIGTDEAKEALRQASQTSSGELKQMCEELL